MSSHFGRLTYDQCYIDEETKQSIKPGEYKLYYGQNSNDKVCHSVDGPRNNRMRNSSENPKNTLGDRTEMESILTNRDLPASKCSKGRTVAEKRKLLARDLESHVRCDDYLNSQHSRLNVPIDNFRGLSTIDLQLDFPIIEPQNNVFYGHNETTLPDQNMNSRFGNNTRLEAKDTYKKSIE